MLHIDRLRLRLPAALAPRAARIGRLLAEELGRREWSPNRVVELRLPPLTLSPAASDLQVARRLADAVQRHWHAGRTSGGSDAE